MTSHSSSTDHMADSTSSVSDRGPWPFWLRAIVSTLIFFHLLAVIAAPWADPPPSSDLARAIAAMYGPYLQLFSLNNGYRFFAPDPGPGHLIRYELLDDSDNIVESGQFPDRDKHWPRLMYHRNFMISEMAFQLASAVPELPPDILPDQRLSRSDQEMIEKQKQRSLSLQQAIADYYLARQPQATHVRLYGLTHAIPTPLDMDRGTELSDPKLYQEVMLGDFKRQAP